jgi:transposase
MGWAGGQPEMAKSYSQDLRDRVLDAVAKEGMTRRGAAARFGIADSSAIKWVQRLERLGERQAGKGGHRPSKIKPHRAWVMAVLERQKDITLQALADRMEAELGVHVDTGMLSRFFKGEGISFKKKHPAK